MRGRVALLVLGLVAARAEGATPKEGPDGFDHIVHEGLLVARAVAAPGCDRCHRTDRGGRLIGAPGHASCFGDCHGPAPVRPAGGRAMQIADEVVEVCRACHAPALLARLARGTGERVRSAPAPYPADGEFAVAMSHAAHARVDRGCRACHAVPGDGARTRPARGAAHARCASCHARGGDGAVDMASCVSCHTPAVGPVRAPRAEPGVFPVAARFSHRKHLPRMKDARAPCAGCHDGARGATGDLVPTPGKAECAGCHDGAAAFSMIEPDCRRCHAPPVGPERPKRFAAARFAHADHAVRACADCHSLDGAGLPGPVGRGHAPCSDAGCHAVEFASAEPKVCAVCHVRSEPWRDLHADPQPRSAPQFGVGFSHRAHLGGEPPAVSAPCAKCHVAGAGDRFGPTAGHRACSGTGCHQLARGAPPRLGDCEGCHRPGLMAEHERKRRARRWPVRQRFRHEPHRTEPENPAQAVACTQCHTSTADANSILDLPPPAKATCARCHDGNAAFKLTGHTCSRCHAGGRGR